MKKVARRKSRRFLVASCVADMDDPAAVGAAPAPAPVAAAAAQEAAASEAAFRLAARHTQLAYIRGGPSPQRSLGWDPRVVYPPVAAQNMAAAPLLNLLLQQAQAAGASPAGLHQGRGGGGGRGRGGGGRGGGGRGGVAQGGLTPSQAQHAFLAFLAQPAPDAERAAAISLRFHRAELELAPGSDLGFVYNATALQHGRCLPSPPVFSSRVALQPGGCRHPYRASLAGGWPA